MTRRSWSGPPDFGRGVFAVDGATRVWKGDRAATLGDLVVGDELLAEHDRPHRDEPGRLHRHLGRVPRRTSSPPRSSARSTTRAQRRRGLPAWIDGVEGDAITVIFFAGSRDDFRALLGGDPAPGKAVQPCSPTTTCARPAGDGVEADLSTHLPEGQTAGTYGCSGVRWLIEPGQASRRLSPRPCRARLQAGMADRPRPVGPLNLSRFRGEGSPRLALQSSTSGIGSSGPTGLPSQVTAPVSGS